MISAIQAIQVTPAIRVIPVADAWRLSIDFGTTFTAAAISSAGTVTTVRFTEGENFPTVVALKLDGHFLTGQNAVNDAANNPASAVRQPKQALAASQKTRLNGRTVLTVDVAAAVLGHAHSTALGMRGETRPHQVYLSHPATWTDGQIEALRDAATVAGLQRPTLLTEAEAAARHYIAGCPASRCTTGERLDLKIGGYILVHDFGADAKATLLRRDPVGLTVAGRPACKPGLGGESLDERLLNLVADRVCDIQPDLWAELEEDGNSSGPSSAWTHLRAEVTAARERLSVMRSVDIAVAGAHATVRVTRAEYESAIEPDVSEAVALVADTLRAAGVGLPDLDAIVLAGGTNRTPQVSDALAQHFVLPLIAANPKSTVAHGALLAFTPTPGRSSTRRADRHPADPSWLHE
jgi:molecular chaperone DnaK (HSP70)